MLSGDNNNNKSAIIFIIIIIQQLPMELKLMPIGGSTFVDKAKFYSLHLSEYSRKRERERKQVHEKNCK